MPYTVPNTPDVPDVNLAEPDSVDYLVLGQHRTGVISGGTVTQSGTPNMTVLVSAAEIVINGVPATKTTGSVTLDASTASPRFDLVGWYISGSPVAIKGSPSNNPVYPVIDPTTFCLTAAVYVSAGAVSITTPYIVQKQVALARDIRRTYTADTDVVLEWATPSKANAFKALANGTFSWVSSTLTRTADAALDWVTSLTIRQTTPADKALILKVAGTGVKGTNIMEVQPSSTTTPVAGMDTIGRLFGVNFRSGNGTPEGAVTADKGTLYLNEDLTDANNALYVKTTSDTNTGWFALAGYVASSQAIPVGCVLMWPGMIGVDTIPVGYLFCDGGEESSAAYPALSTFCGTKFGSAGAGNFKKPDYRGRTPFGVDGVLALAPGVNLGAAEVILSLDQLPEHIHETSETDHFHPTNGLSPYKVEQAYLPPYHLPLNNGSGLGMDLPDSDTHTGTMTSLAVLPAGGSQPVSLFQPSQSTNYLIKT